MLEIMSHRASKIQFGPPSKIVLLCNSLHLPCKYTYYLLHPSSLFSHLFYFIMATLITSTKVPPNWSTQKESSHLGFLSTPASKRLPQKTDSKECYDLQYLYLCHMYVSLTLFIVWFTENLVQYLPERNESLDKNTICALKGGVSYQIRLAAY